MICFFLRAASHPKVVAVCVFANIIDAHSICELAMGFNFSLSIFVNDSFAGTPNVILTDSEALGC